MQRDDTLPVKVLEVNRDHPLLRNMLRMFKADRDDAVLAEMSKASLTPACCWTAISKNPRPWPPVTANCWNRPPPGTPKYASCNGASPGGADFYCRVGRGGELL